MNIVVRKHWAALIPPVIVTLLLLLITPPAALIGLVYVVARLIPFLTDKIVMDDGTISGKTGLINTRELVTPIKNVVDIGISSGLGGKIFGYCTVAISTAGTGSKEYKFAGMRANESKQLRDTILAYQTKQ